MAAYSEATGLEYKPHSSSIFSSNAIFGNQYPAQPGSSPQGLAEPQTFYMLKEDEEEVERGAVGEHGNEEEEKKKRKMKKRGTHKEESWRKYFVLLIKAE